MEDPYFFVDDKGGKEVRYTPLVNLFFAIIPSFCLIKMWTKWLLTLYVEKGNSVSHRSQFLDKSSGPMMQLNNRLSINNADNILRFFEYSSTFIDKLLLGFISKPLFCQHNLFFKIRNFDFFFKCVMWH